MAGRGNTGSNFLVDILPPYFDSSYKILYSKQTFFSFFPIKVLKKPSLVLSSKAKKRLADMAITCYIEQVSFLYRFLRQQFYENHGD